MPRIVFDFGERRPIFRCPSEVPARLRALLPAAWQLILPEGEVDGSGDGGFGLSPTAAAVLPDAEVYMGMGLPVDALQRAPRLKWVHSGTAGIGAGMLHAAGQRGVVVTNSAGVHGPPVAESAVAMILHFARGLDVAVAAQAERAWSKADLEERAGWVREVAGSTVGIFGYGGIGREVARRVHALGADVLAIRRRGAPGDAWAELLSGQGALPRLLGESDYLVLTAPATPETRGIMDERALRAMKAGAVLVNVSRGSLVDELALARALHEGRLRGAALDVFTHEPLPAEHPLRDAPRTLLSPHISAYSWRFWEREGELIARNLERYLAGEPLLNVVDPAAGY